MSPVEQFRTFMETKGMRLTQERELIVAEIFTSAEQFDAEDLVERMAAQKTGRRISRSTVYRTIGWLVEAEMLKVVSRFNDRDIYQPETE